MIAANARTRRRKMKLSMLSRKAGRRLCPCAGRVASGYGRCTDSHRPVDRPQGATSGPEAGGEITEIELQIIQIEAWCMSCSVHTVGGVISPGETIMLIVPDADALTVKG
jgi:hypothetical protein